MSPVEVIFVIFAVVAGAIAGFVLAWRVNRSMPSDGVVSQLRADADTMRADLATIRQKAVVDAGLLAHAQSERENAIQAGKHALDRAQQLEAALQQERAAGKRLQELQTSKEIELAAVTKDCDSARRRVVELDADVTKSRSETEEERERLRQLQVQYASATFKLAGAEERLKSLQQDLDTQRKWIEEQSQYLKNLFETTAGRVLDEKSERLTKVNIEQVDGLMKPLREQLETFRKRVDELHTEDTRAQAELGGKITEIAKQAASMRDTANNLANAMLGNSKKQGDWGEMQLKTLLEQAGFIEGKHFECQMSTVNDDNERLRPDVVLKLPNNESMVIDSKVSLVSWVEYCQATDPNERRLAMAAVVDSMRRHALDLASKDYSQTVGGAIPVTVMFVPIEAAALAAFSADSTLFSDAQKRKINIVNPTTLFCMLHLVQALWGLHTRQASAQEIADVGRKMLAKLNTFMGSFAAMEESLKHAGEMVAQAKRQMLDGRGNLKDLATRMASLGVEKPKTGALVDELQAGGLEPSESVDEAEVASSPTFVRQAINNL